MKDQIQLIISALAVLLLVPLTVTLILSGWGSVSLQKEPDIEMYLPEIVSREIPKDYDEEAIKAQAVLARSTLKKGLQDGTISKADLALIAEDLKKDMKKKEFLESYEMIQRCIAETKGEVLVYEQNVCEGSFHRISAGSTRDGKEVLEDDKYAYITSVESAMDMEAKDYLKGQYFTPQELCDILKNTYPDIEISAEELPDNIEVLSRDSQDYVLEIKVGNITCSGEELRKLLKLNSSNFTISKMGDEIRFLCRGVGHGMGLSQFGANKMAQGGKDYKEILEYYFPKIEIIVPQGE